LSHLGSAPHTARGDGPRQAASNEDAAPNPRGRTDLPSIPVAVSPTEKFREFLTTRGQRLTPERRITVEEVFADHEHFDVETLAERLAVKSDGRRVSRSSVYRHVAAMEEAGLIRKIARQDDRDLYEHAYGYPHHDHLICRETGELIEFRSPELDKILERVAAEHGFRVEGHRLEVYGLSREARKPRRRRHSKLDQV
jgi:Fur family ferric uptake transcriptional regulator